VGYLADEHACAVLRLAGRLGKPVLVEGPAGTGKTGLATSAAEAAGSRLIRLQCYEGLDEARALYEWNHSKQLLRLLADRVSRAGDRPEAGIFTEDALLQDSTAGTPQGGILSPLLANVALSVLDEHIAGLPGGPATGAIERAKRLRHGQPNFRLVRYADDWCLMVRGTRAHAEALREGIAAVLATMGLRLSPDKTLITHIDEGLDFLGWRIQRRKRSTSKSYVYVHPSTKAVLAVKRKLKTLRRTIEPNQPLDDLLRRVNSTLQGWAGYFRAGVSSATFSYLSHYTWQTVWRWIRRKHRKSTWKQLRHRYCGGGWWPASEERVLIDLEKITTTRYRYRGTVIPSPWPDTEEDTNTAA